MRTKREMSNLRIVVLLLDEVGVYSMQMKFRGSSDVPRYMLLEFFLTVVLVMY
jgi:hypothetical protein